MSLKKVFVLPQILLSLHEVRFLHSKEKQQINAPTFIHLTFNFWNAFSLSRVDYVEEDPVIALKHLRSFQFV